MSQLTKDVDALIRMVRWHPAAPLHVVSQFDTQAYAVISTIASQEQWMHEVVQSLYVMADFESGAGPFDEPTAVERARTLLERVGISGPVNLNGVTG